MAPLASPRRLLALVAMAAVLGLVAGGVAFVLIRFIALLTNLALLHRVGWELPSFAHFHPGISVVAAAVAGGLVVSLLARWSPIIRGHGLPEAMESVLERQSRIAPRTALAKPLSAAVAIGTGGPFGAEGPIIVTGGALGSLLGQVVTVSPSERKILLASGAAAGMAATFGAPLAAVVLAIELLLFEFSKRAFLPLVVAASVAAGVHSAIFGTGPLFTIAHHPFTGLDKLPLYVFLGMACGLLAAVLTKGLFAVERAYRRLPVHEFWHPAIGALIFGCIGVLVPRVLGVGYDAISDVLAGKLALGTLAVLMVAKLVAWWFALGSGTSGGTLAPILLVGGAYGAALGEIVDRIIPGAHLAPGAFALAAMAATFGASTGATFASIVFLFELTRDYDAILPLMIAAVAADLVARALLRDDNLMTEKLSRRGLRVPSDYHADSLRTTAVREVMTSDVVTLPDVATMADAARRFRSGGHGAYPVVDATGACVGIIARGDLLRDADDASIQTAASLDVVSVGPSATVLDALELMLEESVDHLPVIDGGRLVGICTRGDVLAARGRQFAAEHAQAGWRPQRRARTARQVPGDADR
ncbi:MAG: chloride channel protein [Actinomycetota bacterium]|nr:chloride channel protein [Actinomycetota bacterium]